MIQDAGISASGAVVTVQIIGWSEVLFGLVMLWWFHRRWHFVLTIVLMITATLGVSINSPRFLSAAFNPLSVNLLMVGLAVIGLMAGRNLPSARNCLRKPPQG